MPGVSAADYLATPARQAATLREIAHRPWAVPSGSWLMAQTWERLLFAHWAVSPEQVREHVPPELPLDTWDGRAWVGVTPFRLSGLRARATPPVPYLSAFLELNARTYVTLDGKPGIWFFSLDTESRLAVQAARRGYRLPYFHARMAEEVSGDEIAYRSERVSRGARPAEFAASYGPAGGRFTAEPGSLEHFLTERYCLYAHDGGAVFRAEIHHPPWPLHPAEAEIARNTMPPPGIELAGEPLLHLALRQDVLIWPLEALHEA